MRLQSGFQKKSIRAIIAVICQKWLYASILDIIPLNCAPETLRRLPKVLWRLLWLPALKKCAPETSTVLRRLFPYWNLPLRKPAHDLHGQEQGRSLNELAPVTWKVPDKRKVMLFPALVTDLCQLSCLRTHSQVSSADQTLSYESHPRTRKSILLLHM